MEERGRTTGGLRSLIWGALIGAALTMIIGFAWGGWTTGGAAQRRAEDAVLAVRAAVCAGQFMTTPNYAMRVKELKVTSDWQRAEFIEKWGWDKMPGEEFARPEVSRACANDLEVIMGQ